MAGLSRPTFVPMTKTTDFWNFHHFAQFWSLHLAGFRSILVARTGVSL
jgi:hypothetical protein